MYVTWLKENIACSALPSSEHIPISINVEWGKIIPGDSFE